MKRRAAASTLADTFGREPQNPAVCVVDGWGLCGPGGPGPPGDRRRRRPPSPRAALRPGHPRVGPPGHHRRQGHGQPRGPPWCAGAGVAVVILDPADGSVLSTSGMCSVDDGRIRRAQALAPGTETGMAIARYLIGVKLAGQAEVACGRAGASRRQPTPSSASADQLADTAAWRRSASSKRPPPTSTGTPGSASSLEFIRSATPGRCRTHWKTFEGRRSAVNPGTARSATGPPQRPPQLLLPPGGG